MKVKCEGCKESKSKGEFYRKDWGLFINGKYKVIYCKECSTVVRERPYYDGPHNLKYTNF